MIIVGIIAEYNPFHRGHEYLIKKARTECGADLVISLMSGNFVQRGEPAVFDMSVRVEMALSHGSDMVFELPPHTALSSAEGFASGAVRILDKLGIDMLVCGSETGDTDALKNTAEIIAFESDEYKASLKAGLKQGLSFPAARETAVFSSIPSGSGLETDVLHEILQKPNNILALEYLKAIKRGGLSTAFHSVKRINSSYHAGKKNENSLYSAEKIRKLIFDKAPENDFTGIEYVPEALEKNGAVNPDMLSPYLHYILFSGDLEERLERSGVPDSLKNRIIKNRLFTGAFSDYCSLLKTREITYTSVSRNLLHLILDMDYRDDKVLYPDHVRLLGFRRDAESGFNEIKKRSKIRLLTNSADIKAYLKNGKDPELLKTSLRIDETYNILKENDDNSVISEISRSTVKI